MEVFRKLFILLLFVLALVPKAFSQSGYVPPKIPEKTQKKLDELILASKGGQTDAAINGLNDLISHYPTWTSPRHELSRIYYETGNRKESVAVLEKAIAIDTISQLQQLFTLGRLYEETGNPDKAKICYTTYMAKADISDPLKQKAQENLDLILAREKMYTRKYDISLTPLPAEINSELDESVGRWTLDGKELFFSRKNGDQEDLFIAEMDSLTHHWKVTPFPFNTAAREGAPTISPDGKYLVYTACNVPNSYGSCDLYVSVRKKNIWTKPVNMGPGFNTASWDGQPCFGLDGTSIYFSSDRTGTFGGRDIWYMNQIASDSWTKPISAGPNINTGNNEGCPFISFDGNTLYFMRDGKEGMGATDLYISRKGLDGKWMPAENMGPPINSATDEGALAIHPDGKTALLTRLSDDKKNDLLEFELPGEFRSLPQQALHVYFKDKTTGLPIRAQLEIYEAKGNPEIRYSQISTDDGRITTTLQRNTPYGIIGYTQGYLMYSDNLESDSAASRYIEIAMIPMDKVENESIVLENVFFETGSSQLLPASEPELEKLLYTLKTNQSMIIEIRGYTDNIGEDDMNQRLSQDRAKAVFTWLTGKGIPSSRVAYKGFGETHPVAGNETEEGRKQNRRTEFYIVKK